MTRWIVGTLALVCVGVASAGLVEAQLATSPSPADLATVLIVMRDTASTPAQKERLVGKVYAGTISVDAVRLGADPSVVLIMAEAVEQAPANAPAKVVRLTFAGRAGDEKVQQLRRDQSVRVRATLKDFTVAPSGMPVANFTDLVIEGPVK